MVWSGAVAHGDIYKSHRVQHAEPYLMMHRILMRSRSLVSLSARPFTTKPVRRCFDAGARISLVRRASSNEEMVDKALYDSRWEGLWVAGIDHGEVWSLHRPVQLNQQRQLLQPRTPPRVQLFNILIWFRRLMQTGRRQCSFSCFSLRRVKLFAKASEP